MAKWTIRKGYTANLGNYESARVEVELVGDDGQAVEEVQAAVDAALCAEVQELETALDARSAFKGFGG